MKVIHLILDRYPIHEEPGALIQLGKPLPLCKAPAWMLARVTEIEGAEEIDCEGCQATVALHKLGGKPHA